MIFGLFDWIKIGAAAGLGLLIGYQVGHWQGESTGYDKRVAEQAVAAVKAEAIRRGDDAKLQSMSDYDLCVTGLRAGGVRDVSACDTLRGLGEE